MDIKFILEKLCFLAVWSGRATGMSPFVAIFRIVFTNFSIKEVVVYMTTLF